jgi:nucleotide-binding universal stress UspA family protein
MYKRILTAVNEHLNSEVAARYAMNLARICEAKLYLCFVAEKGQMTALINRAEEAMKRIFIEAEKMGMAVEAITETGDVIKKVDEIVRHEGIDIVFASTRKADVERRFYAGTVARQLSLSLPCSVALVRVVHIGRIHPKKILVPLKARINHLTERSYFSAMLANAFASNIYLFHSTKPITSFFHGEVHLTPIEWEKKLPKDIAHFIEQLNRYKVPHEKRLIPGKTGRNITTEATAKRFDLVIMGASERSLLSSIFTGNPVEVVLRETPCDLIILKPRHENK